MGDTELNVLTVSLLFAELLLLEHAVKITIEVRQSSRNIFLSFLIIKTSYR